MILLVVTTFREEQKNSPARFVVFARSSLTTVIIINTFHLAVARDTCNVRYPNGALHSFSHNLALDHKSCIRLRIRAGICAVLTTDVLTTEKIKY